MKVEKIKVLAMASLAILLIIGVSSVYAHQRRHHKRPIAHNVKHPHSQRATLNASRSGNQASYVVDHRVYHVRNSSKGYVQKGIASWYGPNFQHHLTSTGAVYNMYALTAASKTLPIPCYVKVTNLRNGRQLIVKVNDRGPFKRGRIIDLSYEAAKRLGVVKTGTAPVKLVAITPYQTLDRHFAHDNPSGLAPKFIQVASYRQIGNADHLAAKLRRMISHAPVHVKTLRYGHHHLYRVRIGPIPSSKESHAVVAKLRKAGYHRLVYR